ncbi:MAG: bifunctional diaminohydroxyphosphoribosylaminopyrimidine deaminase/5-amino-6-(5-phosphoribosylamino)uracil reductase RibD [Acidobacteriota bacterium]
MSVYKDISYLHMCYALAEKAIGWASPNPYVGAVIVKKGMIVGHGYHEKPGKPHAEAVALNKAGSQAENSTAYINLEPCVHWGRTPPCLDKILESKLKRVVISSQDPNPLVNGKGIEKMRKSGIQVSLGLLEEKNNRLNEAYLKYIQSKVPFVTLKAAVTLDGKTATKTYSSQWISSPQTREYMHLLRGEHDAIMVGINTILKDDPQLTVRHPGWHGKKITRIILDSHLRISLKSQILSTLSKGNIFIFTLKKAPSEKKDSLEKKGVKVIPIPEKKHKVDLKKALEWLGENQISSVLVEGGGLLYTQILESKTADKIILSVSPKLVGGQQAPGLFQGKGIEIMSDSMKLKKIKTMKIGQDLIVRGYL